jgi:nucleotide-binding universal stress UspA family protein
MTGMQHPWRRPGRRRVVVGVDGSDASLAALAFAAEEAALRGASLHVLTVHEPDPPRRAPYAPPGAPDDEPAESATAAAIDNVVAKFADDTVDLHEHVMGRAPAVLLNAAEGAVLLVVGRAADKTMLGPTARACVTGATCPVVVVTPEPVRSRVPVGAATGATPPA